MHIVHFSDWHGWTHVLPRADLYVCTGDMLPNFRSYERFVNDVSAGMWTENLDLIGVANRIRPSGRLEKRGPDHEFEAISQTHFLARQGQGYARALLGSRDAPVVCCRGNHDFVDLAPMFAGGPTHEVTEDPTRVFEVATANGVIRVGGVRGIPHHHGRWSDELPTSHLESRIARIPDDVELLVTHAPPRGILDLFAEGPLGSVPLRAHVDARAASGNPCKAHCFGHVHESRGQIVVAGTRFSNASVGWESFTL